MSRFTVRLAPLIVLLDLATASVAQPRVPDAPRVDSSNTYYGTPVADPYRWLEHTDRPDVRAWFEAEDAVAQAYLGARAVQAVGFQTRAGLTQHVNGGDVVGG